MKKKTYVKPLLTSEEFVPQEYVAACYKIKCNVPSGIGYIEKNGIPGYQEEKYVIGHFEGTWPNTEWVESHLEPGDQFLAEGKGCGVYHVGVNLDAAPTNNAMWDPYFGAPFPVYHWIDYSHGSSPHHFSKVSDAQWETNPNAS